MITLFKMILTSLNLISKNYETKQFFKFLSIFLTVLSIISTGNIQAQQTPIQSSDPIFLITEIKVSPSDQEFIEFTNNSNQELEVDSLNLEYHSDSSPDYSNKTLNIVKTLPLAMPAGSKLQLSSSSSSWVTDSIATFGAGLKDSIGWVKLNVQSGGYIYSSYTHWGVKDEPDCTTSPTPTTSQSLKRFVDDQNMYVVSTKQGEDYYISSNPTPLDQDIETTNSTEVIDYCNKPAPVIPDEPEQPTPNPTSPTQPPVTITEPTSTQSYFPIRITEVFPDPISPQTDAEDEYIEIYNPNSEGVNLKGYQLQSGNSFSYKYTFDSLELGPAQYTVVYRKDSGLTLANTSSSVRILDPSGNVLDQTSYDNPDSNVSWSKINDSWAYTSSLTPGADNILTTPIPLVAKTATKTTTKKATTKKAPTKKATSTKKASSTKSATPKKAKTPTNSAQTQNPQEDPITKLNSKYIYVAIAVLGIYNIWEYRTSIKRFLLKPIIKRRFKLSTIS